ncbi:MAG: cation diffusion facilitator family transporter [Eubacteriales bacterium]
MTNFLVRTFVRDYEDTENARVRMAYGRLSGIVGIVCNCVLFLGKLLAGTISGSVSITADAVNNLSDASSSVISLLGFKMASKPADPEHPYGHARYEYLSGLVISVLILLVGLEVLRSGVEKILHPETVAFSWLAVGILAASILVKLWMAFFNRRLGREIHSETLHASAADSRNDVITTSAVLCAMLISHYAHINLDGYMGAAVALFILYSGVGLVQDTISPLLGRAPDPETVRSIHDRILTYPGVLGTHDLMIHDYGPGRQFASVHVEMAAEENILESHDVIDNIERDFLARDGLHLIVHLDPIVTADSEVGELRRWLAGQVHEIDPALSIHDLRLVPGPTHTNVIFDCVIPPKFRMSRAEVCAAIRARVTEKYPNYHCVITVDDSFAPVSHES